jgi:hypothetical protein
VIPGSAATAGLRHLLTELARTGHTGAVHVDGTPGGTLFLVAGRIAYAESAACPDLRGRLVGSGRLTEAAWEAAYRAGSARQVVGRLLVEDCGLEQGELVCHVLAAICDAGHAVLQTPDAEGRFVPDERHWLGVITQLELSALARETARRLRMAAPEVAAPRPAEPQPAPVRRAPPKALPRRRIDPATEGRPLNAGHLNAGPLNAGPQDDDAHRSAPDYATLRRIRQALKSAG